MEVTKRASTDPNVAENVKKAKLDITITADEAMTALPITKKAPPTLLSIPRDIRDIIWEYAIAGHEITPKAVGNNRFTIKASAYNQCGETAECWKNLNSLSLVNRQLREETKLLPFSLSVVNNVSSYEFGDWLMALHYLQRAAIRTVSIGFKNMHDSDNYRSVYGGNHWECGFPGEMADLRYLKTVIMRSRTLYPSQIASIEATVREMEDIKLVRVGHDGEEILQNEDSGSEDELEDSPEDDMASDSHYESDDDSA